MKMKYYWQRRFACRCIMHTEVQAEEVSEKLDAGRLEKMLLISGPWGAYYLAKTEEKGVCATCAARGEVDVESQIEDYRMFKT